MEINNLKEARKILGIEISKSNNLIGTDELSSKRQLLIANNEKANVSNSDYINNNSVYTFNLMKGGVILK